MSTGQLADQQGTGADRQEVADTALIDHLVVPQEIHLFELQHPLRPFLQVLGSMSLARFLEDVVSDSVVQLRVACAIKNKFTEAH